MSNLRALPQPQGGKGKNAPWRRKFRAWKRRSKLWKFVEWCAVAVIVVAIVLGILGLCVAATGGLVLIAWNLGLKGIVEAFGGTVDPISFWQAVGIAVLLDVLFGARRGKQVIVQQAAARRTA